MREYVVGQIILGEIERIGNIKREGLIIHCDEEKIKEFLEIKYLKEEDELRGLRNLLVKTLADRISAMRITEDMVEDKKKLYENIDKQHAIMTVVTGIIDNRLWELGYPV